MNHLFTQYANHIAATLLILSPVVLAVYYWTPKYFRCHRCRSDFKPTRKQRTARLLFGDELRPICPACDATTEIFSRNREWFADATDEFAACQCRTCRVERMARLQCNANLQRAADAETERDGGARNSSRLGC